MKINIKYLFALALPVLLFSCSDDDDKPLPSGGGNPVITVSDVQPALMGDSITVNVNCSDESVALSTLKTSLMYSNESVESSTIRTKTNGDYQVRLYIPIYKDIPDGQVTLHLALQNVQYTTAEKDVPITISRPKYDHLTMHVNDSTEYTMTPDADNPYLFRCTVNSPKSAVVPAYVIAPAVGSNGNEVTFGEGYNGITQGSQSLIQFTGRRKGAIECTFNTLTYEYTPVFDAETSIQEIRFTADKKEQNLAFVQGRSYEFNFLDDMEADGPSYWIDPDFFVSNGDGTYKFNAISGNYNVKAYTDRKSVGIWPTDANGNVMTLQSDGTGALFVIGGEDIGKPSYAVAGHNWWTNVDWDLSMAPVKEKVYQLTLTIGQQQKAGGINFKFFGQDGWGIEFHGSDDTYHISTTSDIVGIGTGSNGHDNGNLYLLDNNSMKDGETYVFTVDLTNGVSNGILTVVKK